MIKKQQPANTEAIGSEVGIIGSRRLKKALRESAEQFSSDLENAPDVGIMLYSKSTGPDVLELIRNLFQRSNKLINMIAISYP